MTTLRLILGDQLNAAHTWFRSPRADVLYLMMEVRSETDYVRHHAQKVLAIFASMRAFAAALQAAGHRVRYLKIGDTDNRQAFAANLAQVAAACGATRFERMEADEWRVERALDEAARTLALPHAVVGSEHFLAERAELAQRFAAKVPRMEFFYRDMRRRHRVLVDADDVPVGGVWNFDAQNREKWPGDPPAPEWPWVGHDLTALWNEIATAGVQTIGAPHAACVRWPTTRREARAGLAHFIEHALPSFGTYQDAMSQQSTTLFHSGLSFALNVKLLHPREVIDAAVAAWQSGKVELASCEGFVRQILGWREFVRGVYWARMPAYAQTNALDAHRPLPAWYWSGDTKMACLRHAIAQSLDTAYAHHIQRLMITGNFALLAGCDPDAVDAWYLGIYIDAFEWVEMPNTRGMSQFADGGVIASKPYAGAASYIGKQSDYCKSCAYDPKRRHGRDAAKRDARPACPFNSLYWDFLLRHEARFARNPRMAMPYKAWAKMEAAEREATRSQAAIYLAQIDAL